MKKMVFAIILSCLILPGLMAKTIFFIKADPPI